LRLQLGLLSGAAALLSAVLSGAVLVPAVHRVAESAGAETAAGTVIRLGLGLAGLGSLLVFLLVYAALVRTVARPAERLLAATERVGSDAPLLAEGGPVLGRLGVAFDRMGSRLAEERRTVEAQVAKLREANRSLAEARESAIRQEKLATVGRLAAGVAHEIGNPLAALLGYMQVLRGRPEAEQLTSYVEPMEREAKRIDRILRDLLDFARPSRGHAGPALASLPRAIERTLRLLEPQKRFHGLHTHLDVPPDLPAVPADEHQLGQVLVNLLLNAADAMGGQGRADLAARVEGVNVVLTVRDTGPGIPAEHLGQIFDPFFTTKPPGEGTGLGLAICHSLVESFGGTIAAANAPGGGAEFRIVLPIAVGNVADRANRG
jgi:signal transduction histidine kinase